MGECAELVLTCNLKADTPQQVIDVFQLHLKLTNEMTRQEEEAVYEQADIPNHPFFEPGWWDIFHHQSVDFPGLIFHDIQYDQYIKEHFFTCRLMMKSGYEWIRLFLHWLSQYSTTEGFVGYTRYTEYKELISLIYFRDKKAYLQDIAIEQTEINI